MVAEASSTDSHFEFLQVCRDMPHCRTDNAYKYIRELCYVQRVVVEDLRAVAVAFVRKPVAIAQDEISRAALLDFGDEADGARLVVDVGETSVSVSVVYAGRVLHHGGACNNAGIHANACLYLTMCVVFVRAQWARMAGLALMTLMRGPIQ